MLGGDHNAVFGPAIEDVSLVRCGGNGAGGTIVVGAATRNGACSGGVGRHIDGEALQLEVGHIGRRFGDGEGVAGVGADLLTVLGPINKGVARGGCGGQGAALALLVGAAASDGAAVGRVGRGGDGEVLRLHCEVGRQGAVAVNDEGVAGIGADHVATFGPVHKGVVGVGGSRHGAGRALLIGTAA